MDFQLVLVESSKQNANSLYSSSGILLNKKYVLITANTVLPLLDPIDLPKLFHLEPGKLHLYKCFNDLLNINVIWKKHNNTEQFHVKKSKIFGVFICKNIKHTNKYIFKDWAIDSIDNKYNLNDVISLFFVLQIDCSENILVLEQFLKNWWYHVNDINLNKGDPIFTTTASFGNRNFIDSFSKGIVSNMFGNNSSLILSDCSSTPGSEGSPVYIVSDVNRQAPIGIILSSVNWWRGEWIGLTLIADIRPILLQLIEIPVTIFDNRQKLSTKSLHFKLLASAEFSLCQIYCGTSWGTAIFLNYEKGIFITNSHVTEEKKTVKLYWKGKTISGKVLYKTPENEVFDVAVLQCNKSQLENCKLLQPLKISQASARTGDVVYSAGFPLFSKDCSPSVTISKGCLSHANPYMLKTTCCIHPGVSGGAILTVDGSLLGVVVSNVRLQENGTVYPRVNMVIPIAAISGIIQEFIKTEDASCLHKLTSNDRHAVNAWKRLDGKL